MKKFKDFLAAKKAAVVLFLTSLLFAVEANAAVNANDIISKLTENFTTAELVGVAIVGGFATLFVFKLIKRML